jgi:hypothetical protein
MTLPLALLQAAAPNSTLLVIGGITVVLLVVLGKSFFVGLFEVITAPGASVRHHGESNTFFFTMMVVLLGGLIGVVILTMQQGAVSQDFTQYSNDTGSAIAQGNSNAIYREMAGRWGAAKIDNSLQNYVVGNLIWLPLFMVASWIVVGLIFWVLTKMFGSQASVSAFLGSMSFGYMFWGIALALMLPWLVKTVANGLFAQQATLTPGIPVIIGGVIALYAFVLIVLGIVQASEISGGQFIVAFMLFAILAGGLGWYMTTYQIKPKVDEFTGRVTSLDPSKPGFSMPDLAPGGGGMSLPPPPSTPGDQGTPTAPPESESRRPGQPAPDAGG